MATVSTSAALQMPPRYAQYSDNLQVNLSKNGLRLRASRTGASKQAGNSSKELLACPICFEPLVRKGPAGLSQITISRSGFKCSTCRRTYSSRDAYLDLTILSAAKTYQEQPPAGTELFRNPVVSFVYERGWRQNFARSGFPGPDEELKMALECLDSTFGGVLVDVSCGSGLFSRRFAMSGKYSSIVALDFSENMLRQCSEFIRFQPSLAAQIALIRADVARLPFATASIDAIHAGAALHCWPSPASGVAEISRILKPGGVFVATTFLSSTNPVLSFLGPFIQTARPQSGLRYWYENELEDLCRICGLVNYKGNRRGNFIMLTAQKPIV